MDDPDDDMTMTEECAVRAKCSPSSLDYAKAKFASRLQTG
jgi:hypothetical protein